MFNNYALLIGVEDYSIYDTAAGHPGGTSSVSGAVNDARTFFRQCLAMGISPERIRVLTSPKLKPEDLGPGATSVHVGEATRQGIEHGIKWLEEMLSAAVPTEGLLTFSGHGLRSHGVALCPSDVDSSLENVIFLAGVEGPFDRMQAAHNLTIVLDCCHAQPGVDAPARLRTKLKGKADGKAVQPHRTRVLSASGPEQSAESGMFGGTPMGAFTWALTSAMGRCKATEEQGVVQLDASYDTLIHRSKELLTALSFEQTPHFMPEGQGALPFMHPGTKPEATSSKPDAVTGRRQLDGGQKDFRKYYIQTSDNIIGTQILGYMIVTNTAGRFYYSVNGVGTYLDMVVDKEYWFIDSTVCAGIGKGWTNYFKIPSDGWQLNLVKTLNVPTDSFDWNYSDFTSASPCNLGSCANIQSAQESTTWNSLLSGASWPTGSKSYSVPTGTNQPVFAIAVTVNTAGTGLSQVRWYQNGTTNVGPTFTGTPTKSTPNACNVSGVAAYYADSNIT